MLTEFSMIHIALGFLCVLLICKALSIVIERRKTPPAGGEKDSIEGLRHKVEALQIEVSALKAQIQKLACSDKLEQVSLMPAFLATSQMDFRHTADDQTILEDRDALVNQTSMASSIGQVNANATTHDVDVELYLSSRLDTAFAGEASIRQQAVQSNSDHRSVRVSC
jgi:hypothetical protein